MIFRVFKSTFFVLISINHFLKTQLAAKYGYQIDKYLVTTGDGYIITLNRVYKGKVVPNASVICLFCGMYDSPDSFGINPPPQSMGNSKKKKKTIKKLERLLLVFFLLIKHTTTLTSVSMFGR